VQFGDRPRLHGAGLGQVRRGSEVANPSKCAIIKEQGHYR